jgi:uncharacterized membrane protein YkvA (DUF1232 family)
MSTSKQPAPSSIAGYITYFPEAGVDLATFVSNGARLLRDQDYESLSSSYPELRVKIHEVRGKHARLAQQLTFLADLYESDAQQLPGELRNEIAFALIYAASDSDMMADTTPDVGFLDDAAVLDALLMRHAEVLERHCVSSGIEWASLTP